LHKTSSIIVLLLIYFTSNSQIVNIENRRIYDDTAGWSGAFDAGFSFIQNKNSLVNASFRPRVQYKSTNHYYLFLTDWNYSKGDNQVFSNGGMIHFRYAYRLGKKRNNQKSPWKWENYTQIQYNQLLDQRVRSLVGSGFRLKVIDKKGYRVFAGSSTFYEYEEIQSSNLINKDLRWSNYLSWYINPKPNLSFTAVNYFQPLWNDFNDFRYMGQYSIFFSLIKRLDFRFEINAIYDSKPPFNVNNWIMSSSFGVRVKLGE
jgi:hypothetical protein